VYIRAEYPLAVERLTRALGQAREYGLLGTDILGSGFDFEIEIRLGAGAFVCGEETALIKSVEGQRGMPVPRPPFPANEGLWRKPTIVNNVESLNNTAYIMAFGGKDFASRGTQGDGTRANPGSKGTKVFALTGKVKNSGLVEVPFGTTLREIIFDIGGGIKNGKKFKGVQIGGPSGGILNESDLDVPIDYETLKQHGSMMGSGGMIVMDEDDCVVDIARFYMDFCVDESCGKCSPCRIGTSQIMNILNKITSGNGEESDLDKLHQIATAMSKAALCALGQTAPNPVLSTLNKFHDEWVAHIKDHKCPAGKCKNMLSYSIDLEKCIGCGMCAKQCPAGCIKQLTEGDIKNPKAKKAPYQIDQSKCIKCGECFNTSCKFHAVVRG
jgi:NADH-quinone oxidoreductase subunit F/NADP-reducing hydrogenase subunit HndC